MLWEQAVPYQKWVVETELFYLGANKLDHSGISYSSSVVMGRIFSCNTWRALDWSAVMSKKLSLD